MEIGDFEKIIEDKETEQIASSILKEDIKQISRICEQWGENEDLSLIHISEPTRPQAISYAVFCLKKNFFNDTATTEIYTAMIVGSVRCV